MYESVFGCEDRFFDSCSWREGQEETIMLQIKNLNIVHKKDLHTILTDFHFVLNPGDKAVIIGEEGNGKPHC